MVLVLSILIGFSNIAETLGAWARMIGARLGQPTLGYSTHVRIATIGRFFNLFATPLLGWVVDQSGVASLRTIVLIAGVANALTAVISLSSMTWLDQIITPIYSVLNKKSDLGLGKKRQSWIKEINWIFWIKASISYICTSSGIFIVAIFAAANPTYRATIMQMSASITSVGTVIHTFWIDPEIAVNSDNDPEKLELLILTYIFARASQSAIMAIAYFCITLMPK